jgi:nucleotide-binding universal stress UspA family protein
MYSHILVPVDGSETSKRALSDAINLAKEQQAAMRIVHVIDGGGYWDANFRPTDMRQVTEALRQNGREILDRAQAQAREAGVEAEIKLSETVVPGKRIAQTIAEEADGWPADLIVIGTHGRSGLDHLLLGSVAERLVRVAKEPVLLVRPH